MLLGKYPLHKNTIPGGIKTPENTKLYPGFFNRKILDYLASRKNPMRIFSCNPFWANFVPKNGTKFEGYSKISRRAFKDMLNVDMSANSRELPTGIPSPMRLILTPVGFNCLVR